MKSAKILSYLTGATFIALTSCKKEKEDEQIDPSTINDKYVIAAVQGSGTYMLTIDDLEKDSTITTLGAGLEKPLTFSHYAYNGTKALLALNYQQGNPAVGTIYQLDQDAKLYEAGNGFELTDGYNTIGAFSNYIITARNNRALSTNQIGSEFYFIDLENNNNISKKSLVTENILGHSDSAELVGLVDAGDKTFFSGVAFPNGNADSVYVLKFDENLNVVKKFTDSRLSYAAGYYKSARYAQIANDENGNTYVFSGAYKNAAKNAGALLISKGTEAFDQNYYFDIQSAAGGYRFRKVWHISKDYFLLEFYNETTVASSTPATQYAIVQMSTKSFNWVNGIPSKSDISHVGWPFTSNGKMYMPITTANDQPTIYVIDPATASAKKGITVDGAESIGGMARLSPQN